MNVVGVLIATALCFVAVSLELRAEASPQKKLALAGPWSAEWFAQREHGFSIRKEGRSFAEIRACHLGLGIPGMPSGAVPGVGDITGDATPELVVLEKTSARECCSRLRVFELGEHLTEYRPLNLGAFDPLRFENLDGLPGLELAAIDLTFAGWGSRDLLSPALRVVLKPRAGRWELWRKEGERFKPLPEDLLKSLAEKLKETEASHGAQDLPSILTSTIVGLVYQGFPSQARQVLDAVWDSGRKGKSEYINSLVERMRQSPVADFLEPDIRVFLQAA